MLLDDPATGPASPIDRSSVAGSRRAALVGRWRGPAAGWRPARAGAAARAGAPGQGQDRGEEDRTHGPTGPGAHDAHGCRYGGRTAAVSAIPDDVGDGRLRP